MITPNIHFADMNCEFVNAIEKAFIGISNVTFSSEYIHLVPLDNKFFVSPVNSLSCHKMFSGIEQRVEEKIASLGFQSKPMHYYLPLGSAIVVYARPSTNLIVVPTQDVYSAFVAALCVFEKYTTSLGVEQTLVCPALGGIDSVPQIFKAYTDYVNNIIPKENERYRNIPHVFVPNEEKIPL